MAVKNLGEVEAKGTKYEFGEVSLAGKVCGYILKKAGGSFYEIHRQQRSLTCSCPSFRYTKIVDGFRSCKHCDAVREKLAIPMPETAVVEVAKQPTLVEIK